MPVDSTALQYDENLSKWVRMRDVLAGEDAVKMAGEKYLPKLAEQSPEEFNAYKTRAQFFNATTRTRDGFSGMIFRKPPTLKAADALKKFLEDCDMGGATFAAYQKDVTDEVIGIGRAGTLIDWNENEKRPFLARYKAERVINWRSERINGRMMLALLVLKEDVDPNSGADAADQSAGAVALRDESAPVNHGAASGPGPALGSKHNEVDEEIFSRKCIDQIRVYRLIEAQDKSQTAQTQADGEKVIVRNMQVVCELYRKTGEKDQFVIFKTITLQRLGRPLTEIPFVFHGPRDSKPEIERPPLEDIAQVNLSHYRSSADLEHGRHFTGLPTAWVAGFPKDTKLAIGSSTAWVSTNENAKAGFLEFTGQGLDSLKVALEQKEMQMAVLGARMLEAPKRAVETAEAMRIRASGEGSVLTNVAASLSQSFTLCLKWALWWYGTADKKLSDIGEEASVVLNNDFAENILDGATILALVKTWQAGGLSHDSLVYNLKQSEFVRPDREVEDEISLIHTEKLPERALPEPTNKPKPGSK